MSELKNRKMKIYSRLGISEAEEENMAEKYLIGLYGIILDNTALSALAEANRLI